VVAITFPFASVCLFHLFSQVVYLCDNAFSCEVECEEECASECVAVWEWKQRLASLGALFA
jgi:hypothetical protein